MSLKSLVVTQMELVVDDDCFVCSEDRQEVLSDMRDELEENKSLVSKLRNEVSVQTKALAYSTICVCNVKLKEQLINNIRVHTCTY